MRRLAAVLVVLAGCGGAPRPLPSDAPARLDVAPLPAEVSWSPVTTCLDRATAPVGSVSVLVDSSGSMGGFRRSGALERTVRWVHETSSRLGAPALTAYAFDRGRGVAPMDVARAAQAESRTDTNLDAALQKAAETDVAVLLTDGVPYSGPGGSASCASGTDVGCVARVLGELMDQGRTGGLWVVPLIVRYSGPLATEGQHVAASTDSSQIVEQELRQVFPRADVRVALKRGEGGTTMSYEGPKLLLALVVSRSAAAGRRTVSALAQGASLAQLQDLGTDPGGFDPSAQWGGWLTPIEVYPGVTPRPVRIEPVIAPEQSGTIDVATTAGAAPAVRVSCVAGQAGQVGISLKTDDRRTDVPCLKVVSLPALGLGLELPAERDLLAGVVRDASLRRDDGFLRATASCTDAPAPSCDKPAVLRGASSLAYGPAAEKLLGESGGDSYVARLSTDDLPRRPWRVLGLRELLGELLRGRRDVASSDPVFTFSVCRTAASTP